MTGGLRSRLDGDFDTVADVFDAVLETEPDREAFVEYCEGRRRTITFLHWAERADGLASWLLDRGVRRHDVVAIRMPSSIDYAIAFQAVMRIGAVATGINPRLGATEIGHIVETCRPVHTFEEPLPDAPVGDPQRRRFPVDGRDPIAIVWTGGTTGVPKGAWFDHHCLRSVANGGAPLSQPGDRRLSPLPFAHVGSMTRVWDELSNFITTVITPTPWTPGETLAIIERESVTVCQGVPTQYRMLLDHPAIDTTDLSSLRIAATGAAPMSPELVAELRTRLGCPVVVRYASTETSLATGTRVDDDVDTITKTVGRPNGDVELRVVSDRTETPGDASRADDGVGRVQVRSRAAMRGYWNAPELTTAVRSPDGWIDTGDLGWLDRAGNLHLAGRTTEMYVRGGYNVYPIEVEHCLGGHAGVDAVAILGAPVPDRLGEIGVGFVVPAPGATVELDDVRSFVRDHLADYKAPDALVVVDALPLTPLGKIDKRALQPRADIIGREWRRTGRNERDDAQR